MVSVVPINVDALVLVSKLKLLRSWVIFPSAMHVIKGNKHP